MKLYQLLSEATKTEEKIVDHAAFDRMFGEQTARQANIQSQQRSAPSINRAEAPVTGPRLSARQARSIGQAVGSVRGMQDELSDDQAAQYGRRPDEPKPPGTDVAVRGKDLQQGKETVDVKWYTISDLPGYMQQGIRALGRVLFKQFTDTRLEDIHVIFNFNQSNDTDAQRQIDAVAGYLIEKGQSDPEAVIDFSQFPPELRQAKTKTYRADGNTFLCVDDPFGQYIYTWPSSDDIRPGEDEALPNSQQQLDYDDDDYSLD